ncbi:Glucan 1,3-beta-glucosidase 3 [Coemansia guatemalensis]|uniref:Glucan 1,3-beta-glucosidase 3 n=1 Tax=Coemansia guatemalensis TaxID=2761395 RepID=A0A9W8LRE2_9FUNG|nr:Glucan 1,3-beta-glucosidase 3 [Coemansia guatemalensis]
MGLFSDLMVRLPDKPPGIDELRERLGYHPPFDAASAQIIRYRKMQGVNLGSLFCLEPWISTELYKDYQDQAPEAEGDLLECMGRESCGSLMEAHWDSWLQREDFEKMASIGINTVRLPVGYWVLGTGYASGKYRRYAHAYNRALHFIGRLVAWAAEFDIGVLIDVHALPGGQNNDSHSGVTGPPLFYESTECQELALKVLATFASLFGDITNIAGLQIINEPLDHPQLEPFYERALELIRSHSAALPVYIGDAWNLSKYATITKQLCTRFGFVVLDTHRYWVFRPEEQQHRVDQLTQELWKNEVPELASASAEAGGNMIIGEYSSVLANRSFDGEDPAECMGKFACEQLKAFDQTAAGCFYWTWRLQHDSWFWSMQYAINTSAMPATYFYFGSDAEMPSELRESIATQAEENRNEWREKHLEGHRNYVSQWEGEFGFDYYAAGFDQGLDVALSFFTKLAFPSKLGFVRQLASEYASAYVAQNGGEQWKWEFEDGFREANEEFAGFATGIVRESI